MKGSNNYNKNLIRLEEVYRQLRNARKKTGEEIVSQICSRCGNKTVE